MYNILIFHWRKLGIGMIYLEIYEWSIFDKGEWISFQNAETHTCKVGWWWHLGRDFSAVNTIPWATLRIYKLNIAIFIHITSKLLCFPSDMLYDTLFYNKSSLVEAHSLAHHKTSWIHFNINNLVLPPPSLCISSHSLFPNGCLIFIYQSLDIIQILSWANLQTRKGTWALMNGRPFHNGW